MPSPASNNNRLPVVLSVAQGSSGYVKTLPCEWFALWASKKQSLPTLSQLLLREFPEVCSLPIPWLAMVAIKIGQWSTQNHVRAIGVKGTPESQSKPATKMVDPEPCMEKVPYQPASTRVLSVAHALSTIPAWLHCGRERGI